MKTLNLTKLQNSISVLSLALTLVLPISFTPINNHVEPVVGSDMIVLARFASSTHIVLITVMTTIMSCGFIKTDFSIKDNARFVSIYLLWIANYDLGLELIQ